MNTQNIDEFYNYSFDGNGVPEGGDTFHLDCTDAIETWFISSASAGALWITPQNIVRVTALGFPALPTFPITAQLGQPAQLYRGQQSNLVITNLSGKACTLFVWVVK
tara:strand:+ start:1373 stop:1693 length:321 start_codon:yes stop_codon:yes gene_type:complete